MSLTKEDLEAIRSITEEVFDEKLEPFAAMVKVGFDELKEDVAEVKMKQAEDSVLLHRIDQRIHTQNHRLDDHEHRLRHIEKQSV